MSFLTFDVSPAAYAWVLLLFWLGFLHFLCCSGVQGRFWYAEIIVKLGDDQHRNQETMDDLQLSISSVNTPESC